MTIKTNFLEESIVSSLHISEDELNAEKFPELSLVKVILAVFEKEKQLSCSLAHTHKVKLLYPMERYINQGLKVKIDWKAYSSQHFNVTATINKRDKALFKFNGTLAVNHN
ncbi:hypothetical protein [Flammeovirga sp. SubArs3]|uniref:hypothetical protein n=1 Tax=Flammeovirga sp. SubArs3 TaxID=2995316 RepID=UPI00248B8E63|nr:hypothetical protein [Flammeovirga sp. SubArs3]